MSSLWPTVDSFVDDAFQLSQVARLSKLKHRYTRRAACYAVSRGKPPSFDGEDFIRRLGQEISKVLSPWDIDNVLRSSWKWRLPPIERERTTSAEVSLERHIARLPAARTSYQMAVIAGAAKGSRHNRRAIDLVVDHGRNVFELIELKMPGKGNLKEHPFGAALELLIYASFYLQVRSQIEDRQLANEHRVLRASRICLTVLGPDRFYNDRAKAGKRLALGWLERELDRGVSKAAASAGFRMGFRFMAFPSSFEWDEKQRARPEHVLLPKLKGAWANRARVNWAKSG